MSILHVNIDKPFNNFDQAWYMFMYILKEGVTYSAFNTKIKSCIHNHAFYDYVCPLCGEKYFTDWTRIVGFYTPINTYSKPRTEEYNLREWESVDGIKVFD